MGSFNPSLYDSCNFNHLSNISLLHFQNLRQFRPSNSYLFQETHIHICINCLWFTTDDSDTFLGNSELPTSIVYGSLMIAIPIWAILNCQLVIQYSCFKGTGFHELIRNSVSSNYLSQKYS